MAKERRWGTPRTERERAADHFGIPVSKVTPEMIARLPTRATGFERGTAAGLGRNTGFTLFFLGSMVSIGVGVMLYGLRQKTTSTTNAYRYSDLPSACKCENCGFVLEHPSTHCQAMNCPKCGGTMWRVK